MFRSPNVIWNIKYKVYYTQNYNDSFSKKRTVTKKVEAGDQKIIFDIPVKNLAKFRLEINKNPGKFVLSDITVKGSKTTELEGKKFKQNQRDNWARTFRSNSTAMGLHISDNEKYKYYTSVNKN